MKEIKERIGHLESTLPGLAVLAALCVCVVVKPELLDDGVGTLTLAGGLLALFYKGGKRGV